MSTVIVWSLREFLLPVIFADLCPILNNVYTALKTGEELLLAWELLVPRVPQRFLIKTLFYSSAHNDIPVSVRFKLSITPRIWSAKRTTMLWGTSLMLVIIQGLCKRKHESDLNMKGWKTAHSWAPGWGRTGTAGSEHFLSCRSFLVSVAVNKTLTLSCSVKYHRLLQIFRARSFLFNLCIRLEFIQSFHILHIKKKKKSF